MIREMPLEPQQRSLQRDRGIPSTWITEPYLAEDVRRAPRDADAARQWPTRDWRFPSAETEGIPVRSAPQTSSRSSSLPAGVGPSTEVEQRNFSAFVEVRS